MRALILLSLMFAVLPTFGQQTAQPSPNAVPAPPPVAPMTREEIAKSILPPKVLSSASPTYTDEARREKISGTVQIYLWVDENGNPSHIRVNKSLGHGLDEKAVEAVRQYKFKPAMLNGKPVKVDLYIDVNFQIIGKTN